MRHLFKSLEIYNYHIYQGKDKERLQVFIRVDALTLEEAEKHLTEYSEALKEKMTKKWKTLPSMSLPEAYNIVTLPYNLLI